MRTPLVALLLTMTIASTMPAQTTGDRHAAMSAVDTFITANERGDLSLLMSTFADDATVFMPAEPASRLAGKTAIQDAFAKLFAMRNGPIVIRPVDVTVQSLGDVAIVTAHLVRPPTAPGTGRRTFVLRRDGGRWLIVHLHASNMPRP